MLQRVLESFVQSSQAAFGPGLISVVLYGSGAEGKLRATSDRIRGTLSLTSTAIRLQAMRKAEKDRR